MKITSEAILKAVLLTFKDIEYYEDGSIGCIPYEKAKIVVGLSIDAIFLDIHTNQVYDILFINEEGESVIVPKMEKPYIYGGSPYAFSSEEEKEVLLQRAEKALEIYQETSNFVSFEKQKRKRENKRWHK